MNNMTEGNPFRVLFLFSLPMIASNLLQQFYNLADSMIVGNFLGMNELAAVGTAGSVTAVLVMLASGLSLGASVVIAQFFGAGKQAQIRSCASTILIFSGALGIFLAAAAQLFLRAVLRIIDTPEEIIGDCDFYLRIYFAGCLPMFLYNAVNAVYVALGNSRTPLVFLGFSTVINVALDFLFIAVWKMDVWGAALATVISQMAAMALALIDLPRKLKIFKDEEQARIFDGQLLLTMLRYAVPSALQQSVVSVGSVVVQATINSFGAAVIAGTSAASKVVNAASAVPINFGNALSGYVGQNIGAGKTQRIKPGVRAGILICGSMALVMTAVLELFAEPVIRLFLKEEEDMAAVTAVGARYIRTVGAFLLLFTVYMLVKAVFKGAGDMSWFIFCTLISFIIRLVLTVRFAGRYGTGVIWWSICIGWAVALIVSAARYFQGGWKKKTLIRRE